MGLKLELCSKKFLALSETGSNIVEVWGKSTQPPKANTRSGNGAWIILYNFSQNNTFLGMFGLNFCLKSHSEQVCWWASRPAPWNAHSHLPSHPFAKPLLLKVWSTRVVWFNQFLTCMHFVFGGEIKIYLNSRSSAEKFPGEANGKDKNEK